MALHYRNHVISEGRYLIHFKHRKGTIMDYLETPIVESRVSHPTPGAGMTVDGYTKRSGAPSSRMIRLEGEKRWRRLMVWCFSNNGTLFVRILGEDKVVRDCDVPEATNI